MIFDERPRITKGKLQNKTSNPNLQAGAGTRPAGGVVYVLDRNQVGDGRELQPALQMEGRDATMVSKSVAGSREEGDRAPVQVVEKECCHY
jgi:hypothetical protein